MRHWGMPTRLLDVTTSIHVALYFAANEWLYAQQSEDVSVAVWAINHVPLRATGAVQAGVQAHTDLSERALFNEHFFGEERKAFIAPVHPRSHSERLAAEQGTFLCMADVDLSLQENVTRYMPLANLREQSMFHKLIISPEAIIKILERLAAVTFIVRHYSPTCMVMRGSSIKVYVSSVRRATNTNGTLILKAWNASDG